MCDEPEVDFISMAGDVVVHYHAVIELIAQLQALMVHAGLNDLCLVPDYGLTPITICRARTTIGLQVMNTDFTPWKSATDREIAIGPGDSQSGDFRILPACGSCN